MALFQGVKSLLRRPLPHGDELEAADLIFVLGGHRTRKVFGALLFDRGWAPRILMSTGDPPFIAQVVEREVDSKVPISKEVWKEIHACAQLEWPQAGQYFAYLDQFEWQVRPIPGGRFGTLGEIEALGSWLQNHIAIRSVLIVSIGTHLLRVRMCCQRFLPRDRRIRYIAVGLSHEELAARRERPESDDLKKILVEWAKVLLYRFLLLAKRNSFVEERVDKQS